MSDDTRPDALTEAEREVMSDLRREIGPPTGRDGQWQPMVSAGEVRTLLDAIDRLAARTPTATGDDIRDRVEAHRLVDNGEDALQTCTGCEWESWDTAPDFAEHALTASPAPAVSRPEAAIKAEALREAADAFGHVWQSDALPSATVVYRALRDRAASLATDPEAGEWL